MIHIYRIYSRSTNFITRSAKTHISTRISPVLHHPTPQLFAVFSIPRKMISTGELSFVPHLRRGRTPRKTVVTGELPFVLDLRCGQDEARRRELRQRPVAGGQVGARRDQQRTRPAALAGNRTSHPWSWNAVVGHPGALLEGWPWLPSLPARLTQLLPAVVVTASQPWLRAGSADASSERKMTQLQSNFCFWEPRCKFMLYLFWQKKKLYCRNVEKGFAMNCTWIFTMRFKDIC